MTIKGCSDTRLQTLLASAGLQTKWALDSRQFGKTLGTVTIPRQGSAAVTPGVNITIKGGGDRDIRLIPLRDVDMAVQALWQTAYDRLSKFPWLRPDGFCLRIRINQPAKEPQSEPSLSLYRRVLAWLLPMADQVTCVNGLTSSSELSALPPDGELQGCQLARDGYARSAQAIAVWKHRLKFCQDQYELIDTLMQDNPTSKRILPALLTLIAQTRYVFKLVDRSVPRAGCESLLQICFAAVWKLTYLDKECFDLPDNTSDHEIARQRHQILAAPWTRDIIDLLLNDTARSKRWTQITIRLAQLHSEAGNGCQMRGCMAEFIGFNLHPQPDTSDDPEALEKGHQEMLRAYQWKYGEELKSDSKPETYTPEQEHQQVLDVVAAWTEYKRPDCFDTSFSLEEVIEGCRELEEVHTD